MGDQRRVKADLVGDEIQVTLDPATAALLAERLEDDIAVDEERWEALARPRMNLHYLGHGLRDLLGGVYDEWRHGGGR